MENIFVEFLPPWIETGCQPAFYDKESGTVLQQTARMYDRVNMLIRMFNKLSKETRESFTELYNYVHDFFDNLDVQEEVDHKLDEMAESGQLADMIAEYIQLKGILAYDTVADLKLAENVVNGSFAETYGFYAKGDKGSAKYKIRTITNDDVVDEETIIALYDDNLIAELIAEDEMNVLQFGIQTSELVDNTTKIQTAVDYGEKTLVFNGGTYLISKGIDVACNITGNTDTQTVINFPNADWTKTDLTESFFTIFDKDNITIKNIKCVGDFDSTNPGLVDGTQEHSHAFALKNAHNITIYNCHGEYMKGDFCYVGGGKPGEAHAGKSTNVKIENCSGKGFKRCFVAYINCEKVFVSKCNIDKQYTYVGLFDLEPNNNQQTTKDVIIKDNFIDTLDLVLKIFHGQNANEPESVSFISNCVKHCANLFTASDPSDTNPYIDSLVITDNYVESITPAIYGNNANLRGVKNCTFKGNTIPQVILINHSTNIEATGNNVTAFDIQNSSNITTNGNFVKYYILKLSTDVLIANNTIAPNAYDYADNCVFVKSGERIYVTNNIMRQTRYAVRIQLDGNSNLVIVKNNTIVTSQYGIYTVATNTYTHTNYDLCDNEVFYAQQGDSEARTLVSTLDNANKQCDTSNYFKMTGLNTAYQNITGIKGQYVKNTNPTLLSDSVGSYYLKGWLCVDTDNQTWIQDKLRV